MERSGLEGLAGGRWRHTRKLNRRVSVHLAEGVHASGGNHYSYQKLFWEDSVGLRCVFSQEMFKHISENGDLYMRLWVINAS